MAVTFKQLEWIIAEFRLIRSSPTGTQLSVPAVLAQVVVSFGEKLRDAEGSVEIVDGVEAWRGYFAKSYEITVPDLTAFLTEINTPGSLYAPTLPAFSGGVSQENMDSMMVGLPYAFARWALATGRWEA